MSEEDTYLENVKCKYFKRSYGNFHQCISDHVCITDRLVDGIIIPCIDGELIMTWLQFVKVSHIFK